MLEKYRANVIVSLIKKNAVIIPQKEKVFFAAAECEKFYNKNISRYLQDFSGVKMPSAKRLLTNRFMNAGEQKVDFLSAPFGKLCREIRHV